MMKKFLRNALIAALALSLLSGCSLFASNTGDGGNSGKSGNSGAVKMTDKYTFEDPSDLDFDTRYVICCDENSPMISSGADYGLKASYSIIYAKEDAPAAQYDFIIADSEEHAQAVIDLYAAQGQALTQSGSDPCVLYGTTDGDALEASIVMIQSYGMISEATVSAYAAYMAQATGGTIQE